MNKSIKIYDNDTFVGTLNIFSDKYFEFKYDESWLKNDKSFAIDPELPLEGQTFTNTILWGFLADISPDRWGKLLQKRYVGHALNKIEYALKASDYFRMGSLRLKHNDMFITQTNNIPQLVHLNHLVRSSLNIENDEYTQNDLKNLLDPSSSLGGARPKSSIVDKGKLYIAKFPSQNDDHSEILWEKTLLDLANIAGIKTAKVKLIEIFANKHVLLVERFDRDESGQRIPFISAMTLLKAQEHRDDKSYVDFATKLNRSDDKQELFRRMVFNMLFGNTDDHLRNHALLYDRAEREWRLSPAYDLNPSDIHFSKQSHALNFVDYKNQPNLKICDDSKEYFEVDERLYKQIIDDCCKVAEQFDEIAKKNGIKAKGIEYIKKCSYFCEFVKFYS